MAESGMSTPSLRRMNSGETRITVAAGSGTDTLYSLLATRLPGATSAMRRTKRAVTSRAAFMSSPFSKRAEASVRSWSRLEVLRMAEGLKQAASRTTRVVSSLISLFSPPITPASATPFAPSAITRSSGSRWRSQPSSVTRTSPGRARRTTMVSCSMKRASKAWSGLPTSSMAKLVASTTFEMGRTPTLDSASLSHSGLRATLTPSNASAQYLGQRSGASTLTTSGSSRPSGMDPSKGRSLRPARAATSRAIPRCPQRSGRCVIDLLSISRM